MSLALIRLWLIYVLGFICEKLKEANFHENFKEFLKQEIQHPEIMNNILQLVLLIKKQSKHSIVFYSVFLIWKKIFYLGNFLTEEQLHEYRPILENIRVSQNCGGRNLVDRTLEIIQNELK